MIVRHLPDDLTRDEKEDLLKYFGALAVRVMSEKGVLVSSVTSNVVVQDYFKITPPKNTLVCGELHSPFFTGTLLLLHTFYLASLTKMVA